MATPVQIEVKVNDSGISTLRTSLKQLQADATTAAKNLADAQIQLGKAAEMGNAQAKRALQDYEAELARAQQALRDYQNATSGAVATTEELTEAVTHQVPQMAAASAAVRLLEGNTTGSIRAAERFLSTTLNLGPALQAAFPVFGALAFLGVIEHVADVTSKFFADTFIYTESAKRAYQGQVDANNALATAQEHLKEAAAELFTATHSAQENINRDIDQETTKRNALIDQLTKQKQTMDELSAATKSYSTFLNSKFFNEFGGSSNEDAFGQAKQAADDAKAKFQALSTEIDASNDRIATSDAKLQQQIQKDDDETLRKRQENLNAWNEAVNKASNEAKRAWDDYNREITEQDRIFNSIQNTVFKQGQQEQEEELRRHDQMVIQEVKDQQKQAVEAQRQYARQAQQLSNDLYQTFTDLTTGNIGKLITDGFKRLFSNILAQWLMTLDGIRNANLHGGAGGLFGALLGSLFGIGGGNSSGSGPYGLPAGVAMSFGDEFGGLTAADFGYSPLGGSRSDSFGLGAGSLTTSVAGATLGSIIAPTPVGGGTTGSKTGGIGALFSGASLAKIFPAAVLGSLLLGAKGGNSSIAAGALVGALGLGALYGPSTALTMAAAPFAPFLGPLAGGLIGFGVGSQYGPAPGALSGAASGAGIGFLAGGPIGAAIGGIIGGLVGLFSGLFGGGPSKHSLADKYINSTVLPAIQSEVTNYEGFRTDFATAINDLEQLKQQSYDNMRQQFGKDATNDEWNKYIVPAIGNAEARINTDEAERQRRGTLVFGAPQFAEGGTFTSGYGPGGSGVAILHNFEKVMTARANAMYGPELAAMEASAKAGIRMSTGGGASFTIVAWDGPSVEKWLRNGGAAMISTAQTRRKLEGHAA